MKVRYFICYLIFLTIYGCQTKLKEGPSSSNVPHNPQELDSLIFESQQAINTDLKILDINGLFTIGSHQKFSNCQFVFECDCCSGDLIIQDSIFYLFNNCVGDVRLTGGIVKSQSDNIILTSNGLICDEIFNHLSDIDSTLTKFLTESTVADTYELEFRMDSCNNKRLLIQQGGNKTSFALETIIDSKAKINSLLASDVLRNFKKLNSVKFNIDLIDTTDRLQECGCLYSESWDKFNKNEYFYANDYETTEYLSINGEQIKIDFTQKNQEYSVIETTYKEENVNGTLRKSGVIRIESSNNFYIEKEFVGECKCN